MFEQHERHKGHIMPWKNLLPNVHYWLNMFQDTEICNGGFMRPLTIPLFWNSDAISEVKKSMSFKWVIR